MQLMSRVSGSIHAGPTLRLGCLQHIFGWFPEGRDRDEGFDDRKLYRLDCYESPVRLNFVL